jgi:alpha-L-rhamnosidase
VKHGATTIWERWNGWTKEDGFFNPHMNSLNHYSLGSVGEWLFRHVAGIELADESPGFQHFTLRPYLADGLTRARATYRTLHGEILSDWKLAGDRFTWTICVPANCTARVYLPPQSGPAPMLDGLTPTGAGDSFYLSASAGSYTITSTFAPL